MTLLLSNLIGIINMMYALRYSFVLTIMLSLIDRCAGKHQHFFCCFFIFLLFKSFLNIYFVVHNTAHFTRDLADLRNFVNRHV